MEANSKMATLINDQWMDGPKDKFESAIYSWYLLYYVDDNGIVNRGKKIPAKIFIMHILRECVDDQLALHKDLFQWLLRMKKKESQTVSNIIYFTTNLLNDIESLYYQCSTHLIGEQLFKYIKGEVDQFDGEITYLDYLEFKNHAETDVFNQIESSNIVVAETPPKGEDTVDVLKPSTAKASSFSRMGLAERIEHVKMEKEKEEETCRKISSVKRKLDFDLDKPTTIEWPFEFTGVKKYKCPDVSTSIGHVSLVFSDSTDSKKTWFKFEGHIGNYGNDQWKKRRGAADFSITECMTALFEMVKNGQELK